MDLHALAIRASKNEILARYFGQKGTVLQWEDVLKVWPEKERETFALVLSEVEGMELDVEQKAARRHEINQTRAKQRFEGVKANLLKQVHGKNS